MQTYLLTPSAEDDLKDIARYTLKQWGKKQSLQYACLLETRFLNAILKYR
ncbi:MAG: type II toxin-antitoxin system RelE/ParE family toxin [Methylobacter sp.]|nr:type II toxin-antitoxin system RelE/ParE family toxin [Methylobacter sp.]